MVSVLWPLRCGFCVVVLVVVSALRLCAVVSELWFLHCGFCIVDFCCVVLRCGFAAPTSLRGLCGLLCLTIFRTVTLVITSCLIRLYIIGSTILYSIEFVSLMDFL